MNTMKQCTKCKEVKPLTDFYKSKSNKDGYQYCCKDCQEQYDRAYYQANRLREINSSRRWNFANKDRKRLNDMIYYHSNKERINRLARQRRLIDVKNIKTIRKRIRARDNYICQICGIEQTHRTLDVHHITRFYSPDQVEESSAFTNLITLCRSCHRLIEHDKSMIPFLQKKALLNERNFSLNNQQNQSLKYDRLFLY